MLPVYSCPGKCCPDFSGYAIQPTYPVVSPHILMLVGEAPGEEEVKTRKFFMGRAGQELTNYLIRVGIPRDRCYLTNLIKCLDGETRIFMEDGSVLPLRKVVSERHAGKVLSWDGNNRVYKSITGWHSNPLGDRSMYKLYHKYARGLGNGIMGVYLTEDHKVLTRRGWVEVKDILPNDEINTGTSAPSPELHEVIEGSMLGDATISTNGSRFSITHGGPQVDYLMWKYDLLSTCFDVGYKTGTVITGGKKFEYHRAYVNTSWKNSNPLLYFRYQISRWYPNGIKEVPVDLELTPLTLAIWFMDDGHRKPGKGLSEIATNGFSDKDRDILVHKLLGMGLQCYHRRGRIYFNKKSSTLLDTIIRPYTPSCMSYKTSGETKGDQLKVGKSGAFYSPVMVERVPGYKKRVYCIDVQDTNCFYTLGGIVHNCRPPANRDPTKEEIRACSPLLLQELEYVNPRFVATVGRHATQFFLGDVNMEAVHGIPHRVGGRIIIPVYHPAAGLHDTFNMSNIMADFIAVKAAMMGKLEPREVGKVNTPPPYHLIEKGEDPSPYLTDLVAIDTETQDEKDTPWCLQFCCGGQGHIIMWDNHYALSRFANHVANPDVTCIIHNSLFDLKVLEFMGVYPAKFVDTMIMAYLLQTEPQGLKPLTFRHLNVKMDEYTDITSPRTQEMAIEYILEAGQYTWPKLDPVLEMKSGVPKLRQPQTVNQKINRILNDLAAGKDVDVFDRWYKMSLEEGRSMVEDVVGVMKRAYLKDVDPEVAYQYAATDPWSTYFIYPVLKAKIDALGLQDVLDRDNGVVPMVETMQRNGMPINPEHFVHLRTQFTSEMDDVTSQIESMVGTINPGSDPQVLALLEKLHIVHAPRKIVKGKEVVVGKKMTDIKAMELIKDRHPVIPLIMRYRALDKLVDSFIDVLLARRGEDNRIRTTLRITRVVTGRLCVDPSTLVEMPRDMSKYPDGIPLKDVKIGDWVYSFDYKRELCLKRVKWVGPTRVSKTVVIRCKARGEEEKTLTLSPDHLVRLFNGKWEHAGRLKVGVRLLCMVRRHNHGQGYYTFFPHSRNLGQGQECGGKVKEHRFIFSNTVAGGRKFDSLAIIHHKDGNPQNNNPDNLELMESISEHNTRHNWTVEDYRRALQTGIGKSGKPLAADTIRKYKAAVNRAELREIVQGRNHVVTSVEDGPTMQLWDLEVEDTHCFIGNEVALHNSSSKPNLMAMPTRTEDGRRIREGFVAPPGYVFMSGDYSQVEMRIAAHISQDPKMIEVFRTGVDLHTATAAGMFKIPPEEVDEMLHRYPAKRVGFGVLNLISAGKLLQEFQVGGATGWTEAGCQKVIDDWFALYHRIADYVEERKAEARHTGMVRDLFGRVRLVPEVMSVHRNIREAGIRQAVNAPIQMGAQGVIKEAMRRLVPIYTEFGSDVLIPLLQIHDDLVWQVREDCIPMVQPIVKDVMENSVVLSVPLKVDFKYGPVWGKMTKLKL